ncbi:MAG: AAA-type ATPase lid domain-containing protein [Planctomycetota bacterium]
MDTESIRNEKETEAVRIVPEGNGKTGLGRAMQNSGDQNPCFSEAGGQNPGTSCGFREPYVNSDPNEFIHTGWQRQTSDLEQHKRDVREEAGVREENKGAIRYAWIGVGQCGGRLVKAFHDLGYEKVLALNTTSRDLDLLGIAESQKLLMDAGKEGTGRDIRKGAKAVQQHKQEILQLARQTFGTQVDHLMVCFGAGGGTGSGGVFELIEIAKRYARHVGLRNPDKNVGVVMTLPAAGKVGSPLVAQNAHKVAAKLARMATEGSISPLVIVDNDRVNKMCPRMTADSLWSSVNWTFANLFSAFNRFSALSRGYSGFDPSAYANIMESGGCVIMGRSTVEKPDDPFAISEAVKRSLKRTLFADGFDLSTARICGCVVAAGKKMMVNVKDLQDDIDHAFDVLAEMTGRATTYRGIYEDSRDSLRVYTIVAGLKSPATRLNEVSSEQYFRPDLVDAEGPQLRERKEDILPLAEYFLAKQADSYGRPQKILSLEVRELLLNYSWPDNVSELAKAMQRAYELTKGGVIQPDALPFQIIFMDSESYPECVLSMLGRVKRRIIAKALELTGEREAAARLIGIDGGHLDILMNEPDVPAVERGADG